MTLERRYTNRSDPIGKGTGAKDRTGPIPDPSASDPMSWPILVLYGSNEGLVV